MKRIRLTLLAIAVLVTSVTAHAKVCYDFTPPFCQFIENGNFAQGSSYWTYPDENHQYYGTTTFPNLTRCNIASNLVRMTNNGFIEQTFNVDSSYTSFEIGFHAYLQNDTNNYYDQLKITVTNLSTGVSERFTMRGSTYNTTCARLGYQLQNNYSNTYVKVKFEVPYLTTGTWEVDNIAFTAMN